MKSPHASQVAIEIDETATPIRAEVKGFCEILGLDPLYLANEGKIVAIVPPDEADEALAAMRGHPLGHRRPLPSAMSAPASPAASPCGPFSAARASSTCWSASNCRGFADMHELGITRNIVAIVAEHAAGRKVTRVTLDVGRLSGVMSDAIRFSFDVVGDGTCVEGATPGNPRHRGARALPHDAVQSLQRPHSIRLALAAAATSSAWPAKN